MASASRTYKCFHLILRSAGGRQAKSYSYFCVVCNLEGKVSWTV
jgi:hypothetical protein